MPSLDALPPAAEALTISFRRPHSLHPSRRAERLGLIMLLTLPGFLPAQVKRPAPTAPAWEIAVGGGMFTAPAFPGASDYQVMVVPDLRVRYGETFSASIDQGARYEFALGDRWTAGPLLALDFGRDQDGSPFSVGGGTSTALQGFADIDATLQAGAFVHFTQSAWSAELQLLQAVGSYEGLSAELTVNYRTSLGGPVTDGGLLVLTGPRLRWDDASTQNAYFGVTAAAAVGSGLPVYRASAGLRSVGWSATVLRALSARTQLFALLSYERLAGDAADSPLVRQHGDANQFFGGVFVSWQL